MNSIEITELLNLLYSNKPVNIVDIRTNYEYQLNRIPTAKNISRDLLELVPEKYLNKIQHIIYIVNLAPVVKN